MIDIQRNFIRSDDYNHDGFGRSLSDIYDCGNRQHFNGEVLKRRVYAKADLAGLWAVPTGLA